MSVEIRVSDDPSRAAAELLAEAAVEGAQLALSGGTTVGKAYELAATLRPRWEGVTAWFGDERAVPPDDERSNYRLARATLLDALEVEPTVQRIEGELGAEEAAARYEDLLAGVVLDFAVNGIGGDGHTASLFPDAPGLGERERRVDAADPGLDPFVRRITLTPPAFAECRLLVYLVSGEGKAEAVRRALEEEPSPATPASLVRGRRTIALLDPAAASLLHV
jgi:6-phosphogluconolactonase